VDAVKALLASQNPHKLRELASALPGWDLGLLDVDGYPPEDGATYLENARAKARFGRGSAPAEAWVLGEDSGIEVDALDGKPGIESARWARGDHVGRLLAALSGVDARGARYVCELVAVAPDGRELRGRGELAGSIAAEARGREGFGFDPVFVPVGETRTVAELGEEWKRANSHRARAAQALMRVLTPPPAPRTDPASARG
jgi:XTP/dITP diphosphohydrolase